MGFDTIEINLLIIKDDECSNLQVRLLIDLTATTTKPYFPAAAVRELGIEYRKILAGFGGNIPTQEAVDEFIQTVAEFDDEHDDDDEIAVVCTHGTSRGGYLICRYLIPLIPHTSQVPHTPCYHLHMLHKNGGEIDFLFVQSAIPKQSRFSKE